MRKARSIDLDKYAGKWNTIASFPAWFQRDCERATAEYSAYPGKKFIGVVNTCFKKSGKKSKIKGKAYTTSDKNKLSVQFFPLLKSDYIIEYVDDEYQHAIVGSTGKRYLWILSRQKNISADTYRALIAIARKKGYDVERLEKK